MLKDSEPKADGEKMPAQIDRLVRFVRKELRAAADPPQAVVMARYMKTTTPFLGVQQPARKPIYREMKRRFSPANRREYEAAVLALWGLPHREEKYAAIELARQHVDSITLDSLPLYERMIREGAWWDLVDDPAAHLVGRVLLAERRPAKRILDRWIDDPDLWIRRTAILAQLRHKDQADAACLFRYCLRRAHETEFFIRKAIGWALRQYSYTDPDAVKTFLLKNRERLSGLSYREGAKRLIRAGLLP
jgi:3-methyladenine DNA glycosylase AlkD